MRVYKLRGGVAEAIGVGLGSAIRCLKTGIRTDTSGWLALYTRKKSPAKKMTATQAAKPVKASYLLAHRGSNMFTDTINHGRFCIFYRTLDG